MNVNLSCSPYFPLTLIQLNKTNLFDRKVNDRHLTLILEQYQIKDKQQICQENKRITSPIEIEANHALYGDGDDDDENDDVHPQASQLQALVNENLKKTSEIF